MFKLIVLTTTTAIVALTTATTPNISEQFDKYLQEIVDSNQLVDGSYQTTYFNIPHRTAPGLIEPFLFASRATTEQLTVSNVKRLRPVEKETRRQQVWDGDDFDYSVLATGISMDVTVSNLHGNLTFFVGNTDKGQYSLNGRLSGLIINVTMSTQFSEYRVVPETDIVPTIVDMSVVGDDIERGTIESRSAQIVGDLVTTLFYNAFRKFGGSSAAKALEESVVAALN